MHQCNSIFQNITVLVISVILVHSVTACQNMVMGEKMTSNIENETYNNKSFKYLFNRLLFDLINKKETGLLLSVPLTATNYVSNFK